MDDRNTIPPEELVPAGAVIMGDDPLPDISLREMWDIALNLKDTQELADAYAGIQNKFFWIEDEIYDHRTGSEGYKKAIAITAAWGELMDYLEEILIQTAKAEGLMREDEEYPHSRAAITPIMEKYGYIDGCLWWIEKEYYVLDDAEKCY